MDLFHNLHRIIFCSQHGRGATTWWYRGWCTQFQHRFNKASCGWIMLLIYGKIWSHAIPKFALIVASMDTRWMNVSRNMDILLAIDSINLKEPQSTTQWQMMQVTQKAMIIKNKRLRIMKFDSHHSSIKHSWHCFNNNLTMGYLPLMLLTSTRLVLSLFVLTLLL